MKVLFVVLHTGYVRNYNGALRQLAARGHRIHIAYEVDRDRQGERLWVQRLAEDCSGVTWGPTPEIDKTVWTSWASLGRALLDYLRYLDPRYAKAVKLRRRVEAWVPQGFPKIVRWTGGATRIGRLLWMGILKAIERVIPVSNRVEAFVQSHQPDVVLVTPLVDVASTQVDYVKAARRLGITSALAVASWDNLTNKGLMRVIPDRVLLWNDTQKAEAIALHGVPADRIVVTGAQLFDQWFDLRPSCTKDAFCRRVGLDPERPIVMYLGSSFFLAPRETEFVERWIRRIRESDDEAVKAVGILIRSHPLNPLMVDLSQSANVAMWPQLPEPQEPRPITEYFDSIYFSSAVVGANTTALIEAAIVGRPVYGLCANELVEAQAETLHFQHLAEVNGGVLELADSMEDHIGQLGVELRKHSAENFRGRRFVEAFVRPRGIDTPATPVVAQEIEALADRTMPPHREPFWTHALRLALYPVVATFLMLTERRPWWVYTVRPFLTGTVYGAAVLVIGRQFLRRHVTAFTKIRRRSVKRLRRIGHGLWYESFQSGTRLWRRIGKKSSKARRRTGKRLFRSVNAGRHAFARLLK